MNGNLQLDPLSAACARQSTAEGFLFLSFSLDKCESGNKQQKGNIRVTWKTYNLHAGTQAEVKESLYAKERYSCSHLPLWEDLSRTLTYLAWCFLASFQD